MRTEIVPQIRAILPKLAPALIAEHGKDIQHAPGTNPSSGFSAPRTLQNTSLNKSKPGESTTTHSSNGTAINTTSLNDQQEFVLTGEQLFMPEQGPYYSANEANWETWPAGYTSFVQEARNGSLNGAAVKPYGARYIGSLVADFHRTLLKGGVFLYPPTDKAPKGKLRLQYEANPLALIAEAAGGAAVNGAERILDLTASGVHDRTPLVIGSRREVDFLQHMVREARA